MRLDHYLVENKYFKSREKAQNAIKNGAKSVEDVMKATGAGTGCGGCKSKIRELL